MFGYAIKNKDFKKIKYYVQKKNIDVNAVIPYYGDFKSGETALSNLITFDGRNFGIIEFLIENGADVTMANPDGMSPLQTACRRGAHLPTMELLINKGADVNYRNPENGATPLIYCASEKSESVALLINNGADVNAKNKYGATPLFIFNGTRKELKDNKTLQLLIKHGAK